jgi:hypothetical protein
MTLRLVDGESHSAVARRSLADETRLSNDPCLIEKVRDIVGLYLNPPDHALVLCVDRKSLC